MLKNREMTTGQIIDSLIGKLSDNLDYFEYQMLKAPIDHTDRLDYFEQLVRKILRKRS